MRLKLICHHTPVRLQAVIIAKEVVSDPDIAPGPVTLVLAQPCVAVDTGAVAALVPAAAAEEAKVTRKSEPFHI